jgi:hypothetical protein
MVGAVVLGQALFRVSILHYPVSEAAARLSRYSSHHEGCRRGNRWGPTNWRRVPSLAAGTSRISYMVALSRGRAVRSQAKRLYLPSLAVELGSALMIFRKTPPRSVHRSLVATAAVVLRIPEYLALRSFQRSSP